jgi:hypothetical protein
MNDLIFPFDIKNLKKILIKEIMNAGNENDYNIYIIFLRRNKTENDLKQINDLLKNKLNNSSNKYIIRIWNYKNSGYIKNNINDWILFEKNKSFNIPKLNQNISIMQFPMNENNKSEFDLQMYPYKY